MFFSGMIQAPCMFSRSFNNGKMELFEDVSVGTHFFPA